MKDEIKNISLAFCCKEDWNQFTTLNERTRFCASCKHQVIDFTDASQMELENEFQSRERVCGRFKQSQMSDSFLKLAAAALVIATTSASMSCSDELPDLNSPAAPVEELAEIEFMGDILFTGMILDEVDTVATPIDSLNVQLPEKE